MNNISTDVKLYISEYVPEQNTDEFIGIEDLYHMIKSIDPSFSLVQIYRKKEGIRREIDGIRGKMDDIDRDMQQCPLYDLFLELIDIIHEKQYLMNFMSDGLYIQGVEGKTNEITDLLDRYGITYYTNTRAPFSAVTGLKIPDDHMLLELDRLNSEWEKLQEDIGDLEVELRYI